MTSNQDWERRLSREENETMELHRRIDDLTVEVRQGFARIDGRLDGIDGRLDGIDGRLDGIDGRLDGIDGRLDGIDGRLDGIDGALTEILRRLPETG